MGMSFLGGGGMVRAFRNMGESLDEEEVEGGEEGREKRRIRPSAPGSP